MASNATSDTCNSKFVYTQVVHVLSSYTCLSYIYVIYLVVQYTHTHVDTVHVSVYNSTSMPSKLVIQRNTAAWNTHSLYMHSPFVP